MLHSIRKTGDTTVWLPAPSVRFQFQLCASAVKETWHKMILHGPAHTSTLIFSPIHSISLSFTVFHSLHLLLQISVHHVLSACLSLRLSPSIPLSVYFIQPSVFCQLWFPLPPPFIIVCRHHTLYLSLLHFPAYMILVWISSFTLKELPRVRSVYYSAAGRSVSSFW